jgi:hypothetical protein
MNRLSGMVARRHLSMPMPRRNARSGPNAGASPEGSV